MHRLHDTRAEKHRDDCRNNFSPKEETDTRVSALNRLDRHNSVGSPLNSNLYAQSYL